MKHKTLRLNVIFFIGLAFITALLIGFIRLGIHIPFIPYSMSALHGPLMVSGFLGTLIGMERASAVDRPWAFICPLLSGLGAAALILIPTSPLGLILITLGSAGLILLLIRIFHRHIALFSIVTILGGSCWFLGNLAWCFGLPFHKVALWWMCFIILTVSGERLELSRALPTSKKSLAVMVSGIALMIIGCVVAIKFSSLGTRLTSAGFVTASVWLLFNDVARRSIKQSGMSRFLGISLISGFVWLFVAGLLGLAYGDVPAGVHYDALLHAVFVGFVFSMIFAHGPLVIPTLLGSKIHLPYKPWLYAPYVILHLSLIIRLSGDLTYTGALRQLGGILNAVAIFTFIAVMYHLVRMMKLKSAGAST